MTDGTARSATPGEVALSDQWQARLRDLVTRVRTHRAGCPAHGVICVGRGVELEIDGMCDRCQSMLLAAALSSLADAGGYTDA